MEVSYVSPPPTSPPEGDDLCGISVTDVAMHTVTLLICLCGLAGNGGLFWLLNFNLIIDYIFSQAITDFLFLISTVPSTLFFLLEEVSCSPIIPPVYISLLFQLSLFSCNMGLYRLMAISIQRCRSIPYQHCIPCHVAQNLFWVVAALLWNFSLAVIAVFPVLNFLCQSYEKEHCRMAVTPVFAINLLLFAAPMVLSSTIRLTKANCGSQQQKLERLDIIIFLTVIFFLPSGLWNFLQQLSYIHVSSQVVFLLTCIYSTIKPFIYFLVGSWRRDCSLGTCWKDFSMKSVSMKSLREALQKVFGDTEENRARSHDPAMDIVL